MMLFRTAAERESYLTRIACHPEAVSPGDALRHAASTNLGLWGNRDALKRDVATVMVAEIRRHLEEWGFASRLVNLDPRTVTPDAVLRTPAFETAFDAARRGRDAEVHNAVRSLGRNAEHMERMDPTADQPDTEALPARIALEILDHQNGMWSSGSRRNA